MAIKKRRKKVIPRPGAGRKKELKRFELEKWVGGSTHEPDDVLKPNEVAFLVRTSGGTPLNTTDVGKLWRLLQHELRALGHKLKRKGQPLDPLEKKLKAVEPPNGQETPDGNLDGAVTNNYERVVGEDGSAEIRLTGEVAAPVVAYSPPAKPQIADLADPDDPHPNQ